MIANIISRYTYSLTDIITVTSHSIALDSDYDGKSEIVLFRKPVAIEDDFVILTENGIVYQGIISNIENEDGQNSYKLTIIEMQKLFYRKVILTNSDLLKTGIEDFIANQITENFISSADALLNIPYLEIETKTHTPTDASISTENGIYNLCTCIGNMMVNYGVFVDFSFDQDKLKIIIEKKARHDLKIDTGISQVINLVEVNEASVLSKLTVIWKDKIRNFFLLSDRTITEDMSDSNRVKGSIDIIYSSAENESSMKEEAYNKFKENTYNHKITFDLFSGSKLISIDEIYIGHKCTVKTASGVNESIITGIEKSSESKAVSITLGQMKLTLIEKLKGAEIK